MIQNHILDLFVLSNISNTLILNRFLLILLLFALTIMDRDLLKLEIGLCILINNCFENLMFVDILNNIIIDLLEPCYNRILFDLAFGDSYILIIMVYISILFILDILLFFSFSFFLNNLSFCFCFSIIIYNFENILDSEKWFGKY